MLTYLLNLHDYTLYFYSDKIQLYTWYIFFSAAVDSNQNLNLFTIKNKSAKLPQNTPVGKVWIIQRR